MPRRTLVAWSGGKDSALALYEIIESHEYEVAAVLTTVTDGYDRISMHGVRRSLLQQQADSLGLPLEEVRISQRVTNEEYECKMRQVLEKYRAQGIRSVVFGDVYLEDIRKYRERNLAKVDMVGVFPLWGRDTRELVASFLKPGFRAVVTCVDLRSLDKEFAGREIDAAFFEELPREVDRCGENGEYHSFVYFGPIFKDAVPFTRGKTVVRDTHFCYRDLLPNSS